LAIVGFERRIALTSSVIPALGRDPTDVRPHGERTSCRPPAFKVHCAADAALLVSCDEHRNDGRKGCRRSRERGENTEPKDLSDRLYDAQNKPQCLVGSKTRGEQLYDALLWESRDG